MHTLSCHLQFLHWSDQLINFMNGFIAIVATFECAILQTCRSLYYDMISVLLGNVIETCFIRVNCLDKYGFQLLKAQIESKLQTNEFNLNRKTSL